MVYKRYIKRDGKTFGPYYYESYRDDKGKTRTKIVNIPKKNKFSAKLIYVLIAFSLILIAGFFWVNHTGITLKNNPEKSVNLEETSIGNSKILGGFIKLIGFGVSETEDSPAQSEKTESIADENTGEQQEIIESSPEATSSEENFLEIEEFVPEITEELTENPNISEDISEAFPETNQTQENITIETNNSTENSQISNESVTAQPSGSNISKNISVINQTITENLTISEINQTISGENFSLNENIIQYGAKLGEPVKWKKTLKIDAEENKIINNLEVTLPKTAGNVSVVKIFANESVEELEVNVKNEKIISETEPTIFPQGMTPVSLITGQSVKNQEKKNILSKIFKFFKNFFVLVGKVVDIGENENAVLVNIQEELEDQDEIEIEYYTEAPYSEEIVFNENHKEINVVGSEEIHYTNIFAFSNLSKEVSEEKIRMYRTTGGIREATIFTAYDNNNNNLIDYIEWIVPSLSNQTYEIILITKAQHLDSNRNFISDIYESVKERDNNWSEQINDSEYVRVTFEKNLTNENDITIYARSKNISEIEVYEKDKNISIANFGKIDEDKKYQIFLINLTGSQDTFDLKILGSAVEFDYIVDPFSGSGAGTLADPFQISNCTQLQEMKDSLTSHYKLVNNIDCSDTINWAGGAGFAPVGTGLATSFRGSLQGQKYNITDLYINNATTTYIGMFGYAINASINEVNLWGVSVKGKGLNVVVGGLVGAFDDNGTISNSSVHGNVTSLNGGGGNVYSTGGLAGWNWANNLVPTIYNSSFTGNISGHGSFGIGGLTGWSDGIINYSFANVKINSTNNNDIGGLVGINEVDGADTGIIENSYSVGNVSVAGTSDGGRYGGLVGDNNGKIHNSYSTANVSGYNKVGGLTGENAGSILNSYSCGNVDGGDRGEPSGSGAGGSIGFAASAGKTNYTYSAGVVNGVNVVGGFVGQDGTGAGGPSYYNFSFYDYERDGGNYNDTGDRGNVSGIFANTTVQMKKRGTYTAEGWDFTNTWQIVEDYSYPYFKWQSAPACGSIAPVSTPISGSGSGNSLDTIELLSGFNVVPQKMSIVLTPPETKTECFTVTSTGTLSVNVALSSVGEIIPYTSLTNSFLQIPVGNSKTACAIFSADEFDIPKNYTGKIEVSSSLQTKPIDVELEIINATKISSGVLPVGVVGFLPGDPIKVLPVGILGFLPGDPIRVLPVKTILPPIGILPVESSGQIAKTLIKGVTVISLWILLLLLLIIYLAVRKFIKLQDQLAGYESRDEKLAAVERLKRSLLRKDVNFFEKMVDKGTIYLSEKALEPKKAEIRELKKLPEILSAELRERYNSGAWLYSHRDYENALKEFERCIEINAKFWQGWQGIGSCYLAQGKVSNAIVAFEKSLEINPNNPKLVELLEKYKKRK